MNRHIRRSLKNLSLFLLSFFCLNAISPLGAAVADGASSGGPVADTAAARKAAFPATAATGATPCVIYENDFSNESLSDFRLYGTMKGKDGGLKAVGSGTSAYAAYTIPEQYREMDYIVEADYLGCTSMGGLLIGATGPSLTRTPAYFSGYTCTTNGKGDKTVIAYFSETGWGGTFAPGTVTLPTRDFHMWVWVQREEKTMTFRTTSLDGKTLYQSFRYELGDHETDIYDTFTSTVGIRQYYNDAGHFDNFRVSVLGSDRLPEMKDRLTLGGVGFLASGISSDGTGASGIGAMLSETALTGDYRVSFSAATEGISRLYFGMKDAENGYALELNSYAEKLLFYRIADGKFHWLAERSAPIREGFCGVILETRGGVLSLYYDNLYRGEAALPQFEFPIADTDGKIGFWLEGGKVRELSLGGAAPAPAEETYLNPINPGADPDMLFYNGTYYLYVYQGNDGQNIFRVYTSPDLVHFTPRNYIFEWDPVAYSNVQGGTSWSPNVFYNEGDGLFYLFFAAVPIGKSNVRHVYYASSDSPFGPFKHDGQLQAINPNVTEIDGHPFVGYDGKTYMSFSRYDEGGTIWLEEVTMKNGVVTAKPETATRVIYSDREWDNDGATRLCEGGFVWKHGGYYYMVYATVSYARHYGEAVAVAKNPLGPYEKCEYNPILKYNYAVDGPGDSLMIPSPDGKEVYMIYHRHSNPGKPWSGGRDTCIDLVRFVPDPDGGPDILTLRGPTVTPQPLPSNTGRYDPDGDGKTTSADARQILRYLTSGEDYKGTYDVDASGSVGLADVIALAEKQKEESR